MQLLTALAVSLLSRPTGSDTQQKATNYPALWRWDTGHIISIKTKLSYGCPLKLCMAKTVCANITMKRLMSDETVLYVTEYDHVKAVRMATVGENLVSLDKRFNQSAPDQTAHQHSWWYS
jgi:hypothetical protein